MQTVTALLFLLKMSP